MSDSRTASYKFSCRNKSPGATQLKLPLQSLSLLATIFRQMQMSYEDLHVMCTQLSNVFLMTTVANIMIW